MANQTSLSDCQQCTSLYTAPPYESALESSLVTARSKKIRFCKREVLGKELGERMQTVRRRLEINQQPVKAAVLLYFFNCYECQVDLLEHFVGLVRSSRCCPLQ